MSSTEYLKYTVVHEDEHLIVVDKVPGMPVQPDRTGDSSLLELVRTEHTGMDIGSPHRLDRPVSGITMFTKNAPALRAMDALFRDKKVAKTYLAIVEGTPPSKGELVHRLGHAGGSRKAKVQDIADGENARLTYVTLAKGERFTLLEVTPEGGAFHQIRAQLAAIGHAIKGDVKYGARRGEPDRSIALHAWRMRFAHPVTHAAMDLRAPLPMRSIWPTLLKLRTDTV